MNIYKLFPSSWGEAGLRTIDYVPVAGSVKAGIEADNTLEAIGHFSGAVGSGIFY